MPIVVEKEVVESLETGDEVRHGVNLRPVASVDSIHYDEAAKIIADYTAAGGREDWTEQEEKALRRKIDWRLLPVLCMTYVLQYYDKGMLSQASLFGLISDLKLEVGIRYSFSSSIFYLGFLIGAYPSTWLAQRYPVALVTSGLVTVWGVCLILTTACHNYQALFTQRFFLGLLESGISPIFLLVVGGWYKKEEQPLRIGIWVSCIGFIQMTSPLINYGFGSIQSSVAPWKIMYFFAGTLTILFGLTLYFVLPATPISATGFTPRERYVAVARLRTNNAGVRNTHIKLPQVKELLLDVKFWLCFFIVLFAMFENGALSTFVPIIINGFGYSRLNSLLLTMPVGGFGFVMAITCSVLANKRQGIRCWIFAVAHVGSAIAALLLCQLPLSSKGGLLFASTILSSGIAGYPMLLSLQLANTAGYTKRATGSAGLFVGYCIGNFIGPLLFRTQDAPRYRPAFAVIVAGTLSASVLVLVYRQVCLRHNGRRDKTGVEEAFEHAYEDDVTDLKNPQFRYIV